MASCSEAQSFDYGEAAPSKNGNMSSEESSEPFVRPALESSSPVFSLPDDVAQARADRCTKVVEPAPIAGDYNCCAVPSSMSNITSVNANGIWMRRNEGIGSTIPVRVPFMFMSPSLSSLTSGSEHSEGYEHEGYANRRSDSIMAMHPCTTGIARGNIRHSNGCSGAGVTGSGAPSPFGTPGMSCANDGNNVGCGDHRNTDQITTSWAMKGLPTFRYKAAPPVETSYQHSDNPGGMNPPKSRGACCSCCTCEDCSCSTSGTCCGSSVGKNSDDSQTTEKSCCGGTLVVQPSSFDVDRGLILDHDHSLKYEDVHLSHSHDHNHDVGHTHLDSNDIFAYSHTHDGTTHHEHSHNHIRCHDHQCDHRASSGDTMSAPTAIPHLMTPSDTAAFATANTPKADSNSTPQVANNAKRPVMSLLEFIAVYPSRSTNSGGPCIRCNCVRNFRDGVKVACLHRDTPVTSLYAIYRDLCLKDSQYSDVSVLRAPIALDGGMPAREDACTRATGAVAIDSCGVRSAICDVSEVEYTYLLKASVISSRSSASMQSSTGARAGASSCCSSGNVRTEPRQERIFLPVSIDEFVSLPWLKRIKDMITCDGTASGMYTSSNADHRALPALRRSGQAGTDWAAVASLEEGGTDSWKCSCGGSSICSRGGGTSASVTASSETRFSGTESMSCSANAIPYVVSSRDLCVCIYSPSSIVYQLVK